MRKIIKTALLAAAFSAVFTISAFAQELVVGGQIVGIQISCDGVMVAGVGAVETAGGNVNPAKDAGICKGDLITKLNNDTVTTASQLIEQIGEMGGVPAELTVCRGGRSLLISVTPALSKDGQWRLGLWLRDCVNGVGTLTFCDPATGTFGALGHSINDGESGAPMPLREGAICDAEVVGIAKGTCGTPGELNGAADLGRRLGSIQINSEHGIFGKLNSVPKGKLMETGQICPGAAKILATVAGRQQREYSVEINRVYNDGGVQHILLTVTDGELRSLTGGIVQGMSGSPIIQNDKIVGAVTHVFVSDPTKGYGISIQDMLKTAEIYDDAA